MKGCEHCGRSPTRWWGSEHTGSAAIETTLLSPLMIMTYAMLVYFMFMIIAYITYGNIANNIATHLNMRQTGYNQAVSIYHPGYWRLPAVRTSGVAETAGGRFAQVNVGHNLTAAQVECAPDTVWLRAGVYHALDLTGRDGTLNFVGDQFALPYAEVERIRVETSKPITFAAGATGASRVVNCIVHVTIQFRTFNPFGAWNGLRNAASYRSVLTFRVHGYSTIA